MSGVPFTHLHVASWYSLRFGTDPPEALVRAAARHGLGSLALTDRDGLYGAVCFVEACERAGVSPVLGTDLALEPTLEPAGEPTPEPAGERRPPRATVLALGSDPDLDPGTALPPGAGWAGLCRLVTAVRWHGRPALPELVGEHAVGAAGPTLAVLLGPDSEVGRAVLVRRDDLALQALSRWRGALPEGNVFVEVVCHDGPPGTTASLGHASRLLALARRAGVPAVLTNAVRYPTRREALTADLLDAVHRPDPARRVRRAGARADLADGARMADVARRVARAAGAPELASGLLRTTEGLAARCRIDGVRDLGLGTVHFPENHLLGLPSGR
ncbi:MAG: error-prone polymerase, partial [Actinomycetota bacterium]|nr:error-prone polymerase [Actinomycetota bacterium]